MSRDRRELSITVLHVVLGAVLLLAVLAAAAAIHLAHGQNPSVLLVYAAGVLVVLEHRGGSGALAGGPAR